MPANTEPIYPRAPSVQWVTDCTAGNNTQDLTSGTSYLVFTADATNGSFVKEVRVKANPANNTAATVARIWVNNGSTLSTAANTAFVTEASIPATTASATNALADIVIPINAQLPAGYRIYITFGTAPGGSGRFTATAFGGHY